MVYDLVSQEEYLMVSDPKAIQHIYVNSQSFVRPKYSRALLKMLFGPAIGIAEHEDHKRQRKIMLPAFGSPRLRNLFPVFIRHTQKVSPPNAKYNVDVDGLQAGSATQARNCWRLGPPEPPNKRLRLRYTCDFGSYWGR